MAGAAQALVLIALLAAETIAALMTIELIARRAIRRPTDRQLGAPDTTGLTVR